MTTETQFRHGAKLRHDYSDMIQVRYPHPNGEPFDTWVSGAEVMARLDTAARERLIKSFSSKNWQQAKESLRTELEAGKEKAQHNWRGRLADKITDAVGGNILGDTVADNVRGVDSNQEPHAQEKQLWQSRLHDPAFRNIVLELAWINLRGAMPDEGSEPEADDWV